MRGRTFILVAVTAVVVVVLAVGGAAIARSRGGASPTVATVDEAVRVARAALPASARDVHGGAGGELLSVDLRGDGSAEVVLYDYAADVAHDVMVRGGRVSADQTAARVQPPASGDETADAFGIALRASPALPFTTTFAAQQGVPLVSADQVHVQAETWTAANPIAPRVGAGRADVCGVHRCVQLVVATAAGEYLDTTGFVVDLSAGRVLRLGGGS